MCSAVRMLPAIMPSFCDSAGWQLQYEAQMRCKAGDLQSPPKGKHRYVFIVYPQHGRVNAKMPKTRQSFTLHQFEKVGPALSLPQIASDVLRLLC